MAQTFITPKKESHFTRLHLSGVALDGDADDRAAGKGYLLLTDGEVRELISALADTVDPPVYYQFTVWAKTPAALAAAYDDQTAGPVFSEGDIKDALDRALHGMVEEGCEFIVESPNMPQAGEMCSDTYGMVD